MTTLMAILLAIFLGIMVVVAFLALRHRIMLKLGLRNIPRRPAQTVLIVVGSMLSAVIITASFATGDTISTSIRNAAIEGLGTVDEILSDRGRREIQSEKSLAPPVAPRTSAPSTSTPPDSIGSSRSLPVSKKWMASPPTSRKALPL